MSKTIALICCAISSHLTNDYEPVQRYNEAHQSFGVHAERNGIGFMSMTFKDSFSKQSQLHALTGMYDATPWLRIGAGAGYIKTSYYEGAYAAPLLEVGYNNVWLQGSFQPKVSGGDAVAAVQLKLRF